MKRNQRCFYSILLTAFISFLSSCEDSSQENIFQRLEMDAGISTFPLTIVTSNPLNGETFPEDIKNLCSVSKSQCKTLPLAGVLRLGPDQYYTYNCISELEIPGSIKNDEGAVTDAVEKQVNTYLSFTGLKNFDSLRTPNQRSWDLQNLSLNYISNTVDSVFFYSNLPNTPSAIQVGNKQYLIYTNAQELRRKMDEIVCKKSGSISVFYNPAPFAPTAESTATNRWPAAGTAAGDTCIGQSKYVKLHDGSGGFTSGKLIELNSSSCGFSFPTGVAGDTCVSGSKYQKLHNGKGGFSVGSLIERNSRSCGFTYPTGVAGDTCLSGSKYQKLHNGRGGFSVGSLIERNSTGCGFVYPARGTRADGLINYNGTNYEKLHDGKGGFMRGKLIEPKPASVPKAAAPVPERKAPAPVPERKAPATVPERKAVTPAPERTTPRTAPAERTTEKPATARKPERTSSRCVSRSEPTCERDESGNYTGRRVQYCYDKSGTILQTIVISKCETDCRCLGY